MVISNTPLAYRRPYGIRRMLREDAATACFTLLIGGVAGVGISVFSTIGASIAVAGLGGVAEAAIMGTTFLLSSAEITRRMARGLESDALETYCRTASKWVVSILPDDEQERHLETVRLFERFDRKWEHATVQRDLMTTIAFIAHGYGEISDRVSTVERERAREAAAAAIVKACDHAREIYDQTAMGRLVDASRTSRRHVDDFTVACAQIADGRTPDGQPLLAVTGNALIERISDTARRLLAMDRGIVDASGAPIAPLVEVHLPALLARHAEAARTARLADLPALDRELAKGVELIRRSVEEGADSIRDEKAAALRRDIAFLTMRRGDEDHGLVPVPSETARRDGTA